METTFNEILQKIDNDVALTKDDAISLLQIDVTSNDFYTLLAKSNEMSRRKFGEKGYIFAQIGLNAEKCSGNCKFCSLACDNFSMESVYTPTDDELFETVKRLNFDHLDSLFLMTTADFSIERFLNFA
ncbi:MAG: radical SAM protein, partial [Clostridia bacterium]